jgi:HK97 family phage major capsid protein
LIDRTIALQSKEIAAMSVIQALGKVHAEVEMRSDAGDFLRYAHALALSKGDRKVAAEVYALRWPRPRGAEIVRKAATAVGSTTDTTWAAPLAELRPLSSAFIDYLRPLTVIGRMIGMRVIPFNVKVPRQTASVSMSWIGESHVTPAGALAFDTIEFTHSKIAGLCVISEELARLADPAAERVVQNDLAASVAQFTDQAFLDPGRAATDISPASITSGATDVPSSGSTAAAVEADIVGLLNAVAAGSNLVSPYLVMKPTTALFLATLRSANDQQVFPNIGVTGGSILGVPVVVSANVPSDNNSPGDDIIVALDASEILVADGGIEFSNSSQATIEMSSTPDSPATASTNLISLWQHNLLGIMAIRHIRWAPRRSGAVAVLTGLSI